jgi:hypothetical protein
MTITLKSFLLDLLEAVEPFKDAITNVMILEKDGVVKAAGKSRDGSLTLQVTAKGPIEDFTGKACIGSLSYLRRALLSKNMNSGELKLNYGNASNGEEVLRSINLIGTNEFNLFYQAIDPFVNQMNRIKLPSIANYPVVFGIDKNFINNFDDTYKVNSLAPKIGSERDDIFVLVLVPTDDGISIEGIFGDKSHAISVQLTAMVETAINEPTKMKAHFLISRFRTLLQLIDKGEGIGYLSDKSLKIDIETTQADYQYVMSAKKVMARE